jgi:hypothetical protein
LPELDELKPAASGLAAITRRRRIHQREAVETLIWLTVVANIRV